MRSTIFNALYVTVSAAFVFALAPLSLLPGTQAIRVAARTYARTILFLMKHVAGISVEMRGAHRLPNGPFLIAAKHQSWGDGYAMVSYFDDLTELARGIRTGVISGWTAFAWHRMLRTGDRHGTTCETQSWCRI
jgi:1-acyl-sn-glycerol-3-phosphate acyltransferase